MAVMECCKQIHCGSLEKRVKNNKGYVGFRSDIALIVEILTNKLGNMNSNIIFHMIQYIVHTDIIIYKIWFGGGD